MPPFKLGPFTVTRAPRGPRTPLDARSARMLFIVTLASAVGVVFHELYYRRFYGPSDQEFPLFGVISHPGADMLLLGALIFLAVAVELHRNGDEGNE